MVLCEQRSTYWFTKKYVKINKRLARNEIRSKLSDHLQKLVISPWRVIHSPHGMDGMMKGHRFHG